MARKNDGKLTEFLLYKNPNGEVKIDVLLQNETIWLPQKKIAQLFDVNVPAISKHLKNIFESRELDEKVVVSILEIPTEHGAIEGKTQVNKTTPDRIAFGATAWWFLFSFYSPPLLRGRTVGTRFAGAIPIIRSYTYYIENGTVPVKRIVGSEKFITQSVDKGTDGINGRLIPVSAILSAKDDPA